jgi:hypothetical protein
MIYFFLSGDAHAMPVPPDAWPAVNMDDLGLAAIDMACPGTGHEREPNSGAQVFTATTHGSSPNDAGLDSTTDVSFDIGKRLNTCSTMVSTII